MYVVSADVAVLVELWGQRRGFFSPSPDFYKIWRESFAKELSSIFPEFELVDEEFLRQGVNRLVSASSLPLVSLDPVYLDPRRVRGWLDFSRQVDLNKVDQGMAERQGGLLAKMQFQELQRAGLKEIALVDDVIFSGSSLTLLISQLQSKYGIRVPVVYSAIGIEDGVKAVEALSCEVVCLRTYSAVLDAICERDFVPGVLLSGRTLDTDHSVGLSYILPFGDPIAWASIPCEKQIGFSQFCLRHAQELFCEIERCSDRIVLCSDIEREPLGMPTRQQSYVGWLDDLLS